jgi:hypothetical protein
LKQKVWEPAPERKKPAKSIWKPKQAERSRQKEKSTDQSKKEGEKF